MCFSVFPYLQMKGRSPEGDPGRSGVRCRLLLHGVILATPVKLSSRSDSGNDESPVFLIAWACSWRKWFADGTGATLLRRKSLLTFQASASPRRPNSSSNLEKSSYCRCCGCGWFNTGERSFHFSAPHSTDRRASPNPAEAGPASPEKVCARHFRQVTAERARFPDQRRGRGRHSWNPKCVC